VQRTSLRQAGAQHSIELVAAGRYHVVDVAANLQHNAFYVVNQRE